MRKANGDTSISARRAGVGDNYTVHPNPAQTNDCNEYPFAATHEGTCAVKQSRPREADDRIPEGDPFYTMITD